MNKDFWVFDDGGRAAAGYKGTTGDCACRAVAITSGLPYQEVYDRMIEMSKRERKGKRKRGVSHPRTGVYRALMHRLLVDEFGWTWTPLMGIGTGCTHHLVAEELPKTGRHVLSLSKHYAALVDGKVRDTYVDDRGGTRCVYGYWTAPNISSTRLDFAHEMR